MKIFNHITTTNAFRELKKKEVNGSRQYLIEDNKFYPSITTVLGKDPDKIAGLKQWRKRVGTKEANKISTQSSRRGTRVHNIVEDYLKNDLNGQYNDNPLGMGMFTTLQPVLDERLDNIHAQEVTLWSDHLGVAGQVDCVAEFDKKISIVDFKTSSKPKKPEWIHSYYKQAAGYAVMWEERTGIPITQLVVLVMVDGDNPQIFIEHRDNWTESLIESIDYYKKEYMNGL
jgi:genome maintenance exonuclease 1